MRISKNTVAEIKKQQAKQENKSLSYDIQFQLRSQEISRIESSQQQYYRHLRGTCIGTSIFFITLANIVSELGFFALGTEETDLMHTTRMLISITAALMLPSLLAKKTSQSILKSKIELEKLPQKQLEKHREKIDSLLKKAIIDERRYLKYEFAAIILPKALEYVIPLLGNWLIDYQEYMVSQTREFIKIANESAGSLFHFSSQEQSELMRYIKQIQKIIANKNGILAAEKLFTKVLKLISEKSSQVIQMAETGNLIPNLEKARNLSAANSLIKSITWGTVIVYFGSRTLLSAALASSIVEHFSETHRLLFLTVFTQLQSFALDFWHTHTMSKQRVLLANIFPDAYRHNISWQQDETHPEQFVLEISADTRLPDYVLKDLMTYFSKFCNNAVTDGSTLVLIAPNIKPHELLIHKEKIAEIIKSRSLINQYGNTQYSALYKLLEHRGSDTLSYTIKRIDGVPQPVYCIATKDPDSTYAILTNKFPAAMLQQSSNEIVVTGIYETFIGTYQKDLNILRTAHAQNTVKLTSNLKRRSKKSTPTTTLINTPETKPEKKPITYHWSVDDREIECTVQNGEIINQQSQANGKTVADNEVFLVNDSRISNGYRCFILSQVLRFAYSHSKLPNEAENLITLLLRGTSIVSAEGTTGVKLRQHHDRTCNRGNPVLFSAKITNIEERCYASEIATDDSSANKIPLYEFNCFGKH